MKTFTQSLLALALGVATLTSFGQDAPQPPRGEGGRPGGPGGGRGRPVPPLVAALDVDKNHEISAGEIAGAAAALAALDKNQDGKLTADELHPPRPEGEPPRPDGAAAPGKDHPDRPRPHPPLVTALDADGDGEISAAELTNAPAALKALDKNGDGKLTSDEFAGPRPGRGPGPGGPGGPGGPRGNGRPGQPPKDA